MDLTTPQPNHEQGTHFWLITIQASHPGGGVSTRYFQGTVTPAPGETRMDVFNRLLQEVSEVEPAFRQNGVVLAFDLQPNQL